MRFQEKEWAVAEEKHEIVILLLRVVVLWLRCPKCAHCNLTISSFLFLCCMLCILPLMQFVSAFAFSVSLFGYNIEVHFLLNYEYRCHQDLRSIGGSIVNLIITLCFVGTFIMTFQVVFCSVTSTAM
ncbi:hypothetical protein E2542_SST02932 [Spatholobus suberectus]|nr:hypothetical protein E2542_SST02932 [Spatholobus suberectus]